MKRLLVIRLGALGDLLHVSPSIAQVKAAYPDVEIHWLTSPVYQDLLSLVPGVDRVWSWDKRAGWPGLFRLAAQLRQAGIDGIVNLHPSLKTWLLAQWVGPQRQAVYRKEKLKIKGEAQRLMLRRHAISDFHEPFRRIFGLARMNDGIPSSFLKPLTDLPLKSSGEQWLGLIPGVGAKRSNRAWEPDAYATVIQQLLARHSRLRILLIGGPDEKLLAERLMQSVSQSASDDLNRLENHCGLHDIPGTAKLLSQCDLVIGGDTGPMHLAAAVGAPLVAIYGPTSLARTGPVSRQPLTSLTPPHKLACWPCELSECSYTGADHLACMKTISVEQVLLACEEILMAKSPSLE